MFYMYVLVSEKDGKLYKGFTDDLRRRFSQHNAGENRSTKMRTPFRLAYYEAYSSKKDAMRRELQMKHNARAWAQLKRRINDSLNVR